MMFREEFEKLFDKLHFIANNIKIYSIEYNKKYKSCEFFVFNDIKELKIKDRKTFTKHISILDDGDTYTITDSLDMNNSYIKISKNMLKFDEVEINKIIKLSFEPNKVIIQMDVKEIEEKIDKIDDIVNTNEKHIKMYEDLIKVKKDKIKNLETKYKD